MIPPRNAGGGFPATRGSMIAAARDGDDAARRIAFDAIVGAYWKPAYKYVRLQWRAAEEEAEDLVQGFFAAAFEKSFFARYDQDRARFRTYLRTCIDGFVQNARKAQQRLKRGGGALLLPLDFATAEGELRAHEPVAAGTDVEELFHREWVRHLFAEAVGRLRSECAARGKDVQFAIFQAYDLEPEDNAARPSYAELAARHAIAVTQVTNHLAWCRARFRQAVLATLAAITGSEAEYRAEARAILGIEVS
jgi:DNA-directed RNA polymerase specialized sigma24 family protein